LIGLEIGIVWTAMAQVMTHLDLPEMLTAAVLCLYPFFVTGFIHLDGFMDVTDAVKSWRSLERRREILKDSRVGAFAVISCGALMIMQFAAMVSVEPGKSLMLIFIPVISRCLSALAVTVLRPMSGSQYEGQKSMKTVHSAVYTAVIAAAAAAAFMLCGVNGFAAIGVLIGYGAALCRAYRSLQGMNGDISGYALTIGELCGLIVLAVM